MQLPQIQPSPTFEDPAPDNVLPFLAAARRAGRRAALLTLVHRTGSSPRGLGAQMVVCEDGESLGMISGGCIEENLVLEAREAIAEGRNRTTRYGQGSRYFDLRLPCGTGIDVHFDVTLPLATVETLLAGLAARQAMALTVDPGSELLPLLRGYLPERRLLILGGGPIVSVLAPMARACGIVPHVFTGSEPLCHTLDAAGIATTHVRSPRDVPASAADPYCGVLTCSHDHHDEPEALHRLLTARPFFIGALGSRMTHLRRTETLRALGTPETEIARIRGPVGIDLAARTPLEIALSIVAQVTGEWNRTVVQRFDAELATRITGPEGPPPARHTGPEIVLDSFAGQCYPFKKL